MQTQTLKIESPGDTEKINAAAEILKSGGLVAIPTETVYGLAANAFDGKAVAKIFKAKGRPQDNPLIAHIASLQELYHLAGEVPDEALCLAGAFWPGPLTIVLPKSEAVPDEVSAGLPTVAVRMPAHPIAQAVIKAAGMPLAAPSANASGRPSPTSARHVLQDLDGKIDAVIDGGECAVGVESTVISLSTKPPRLLRPGGITPAQLEAVLGKIEIDEAVFSALKECESPASPGLKYKHYSPKAKVIIVKAELEPFKEYVRKNKTSDSAVLCFNGEEAGMPVKAVCYGNRNKPGEQAHRLFHALREVDEIQADLVFARCPETEGLGLAVYNRLLRAAAFEVVEL